MKKYFTLLFSILLLSQFSIAQNTICEGDTGTFVLQGYSGNIQWQKSTDLTSWTNVSGAINDELTIIGTTGLEYYRAEVTEGTCNPFYSDTVFFDVLANVAASVNITSSVGIFICEGDTATFTASGINAGQNPNYIWKVNNQIVSVSSNNIFETDSLNSGDNVSCSLVSSETCLVEDTVTSNAILMFVEPIATPTVSISASSTTICELENVTFTSNVSNTGGANISYQWFVNGNMVATTANYSSNNLQHQDSVWLEITSDAICAPSAASVSNVVVMTVFYDVFPNVFITASKNNICPGESITFSATTQDAGLNPGYTWKRNGNVVSINLTYTANNFNNGDQITLEIVNNDPCITFPTATSNNIQVNVQTPVSPDVTISAFPSNNFCQGENATFIANPFNFGNNPIFDWKVNGVSVGVDSIVFVSNNINDGDQIICEVTGGGDICLFTNTLSSLPITANVNPTIIPTVNVVPQTSTTACAGDTISFVANVSGQMGASISYQWKVNGNTVSTNTFFESTSLFDGDSVWCNVQLVNVCTPITPISSNGYTVSIFAPPTPSATISYICNGGNFEFSAITQNEGINPEYEWQVNGNTIDTNAVFISNNISISDEVRLIITNNDCGQASSSFSNTLVINTGC